MSSMFTWPTLNLSAQSPACNLLPCRKVGPLMSFFVDVQGPPEALVVRLLQAQGPLPTIWPAAMGSHVGSAQLDMSPLGMNVYACGWPSGPVIVVCVSAPPQLPRPVVVRQSVLG